MQRQPGCLSCEIVSGKRREPGGVLYEDDNWHLGSVLPPVVWRGFCILKLKRHCTQIADLTPAEAAALGPILQKASRALVEVLHPAKVYVCSFGDGVQHIHFWLLPRPQTMRPGMHAVMAALDLRIALTRLGFKRWIVPQTEIDALTAQIRQQMQSMDP